MNILSDKIVITRKKNMCNACCRRFDKGTSMRTQVNTYDGIQVWRECPTCQILLSKHRKNFADDYNICEEGCVNDVKENCETPEELLIRLNLVFEKI